MINDKKGFVFTGISFLLVIPAVVLIASYISMIQIGDFGIGITMAGDKVFYTCDNIFDYLEDGARKGERSTVLAQANVYSNNRDINFTSTPLGGSLYQVSLESRNIKCSRTLDIRNGTLTADLNLTNYAQLYITPFNTFPMYLRSGIYSLINTSTKVTYPWGSLVDGANVTVNTLGNSTSGASTTGYYNVSFNMSTLYSTDCESKELLGTKTATSTATYPDYYDGVDTEEYIILGNITNALIRNYKPSRREMGMTITLIDELGYPVTQYSDSTGIDCGDNYTAPFPSITARLYEGGTEVMLWNSSSDYTETYKSDNSWNGIFWTDPNNAYSFKFNADYTGVVNVTQPGYLDFNWAGPFLFTDFEATAVTNADTDGMKMPQNEECFKPGTGSDQSIILNITNAGTTLPSNITVEYKYCDGIGCDNTDISTFKQYYTPVLYDVPGAKGPKGGNWLVCEFNSSITLTLGDSIFANITSVGTPNLDGILDNNFINGTAT